MKVKEIIELLEFISSTELNEVKIETAEIKLAVRKESEVVTRFVEHPVATQAPVTQLPVAPVVPTTPATTPTTPANDDSKYIAVKSPMIGTFYRSSNPETPPFVNVGDKVTIGKPVCVIEAMKLFNEIESEVSGTVVKILVENASPVEYDQPLFLVDPS